MAALVGLVGGIALGLAARVGRFCTLGAIEDVLYGSDDRRIRMWGVAIAIAIIGTQFAVSFGFLEGEQTAYLDRVWNPLGTIVGGLLFGYGMALSGNCGYGALARLGGGDLRAFVIVIVMCLSAYFVMSGPLAYARVWLFPAIEGATTPQGFGQLGDLVFGIEPFLTGLVIGGAILAVSLGSKSIGPPFTETKGAVIEILVIVTFPVFRISKL